MRSPRALLACSIPVALSIVLAGEPAAAAARSRALQPAGAQSMDLARRIDVNNLSLFVTNFGSWAYDLSTGNAGLIYPKGTSKTAVFASGLWLGAKVNGQVRVTVAEYSEEYGPGAMLPGGAWDDPTNPGYRVYKVARWTGDPQDSARVERAVDPGDPTRPDPLVHDSWSDYMQGAVPHGGPWRLWRLPDATTPDPSDSVDVPGPDVLGDQMLWCVYNDADPTRHTNQAGNSLPLGVEVRQSVWGYARAGALGNAVFLMFRIVNRGANALDSVYVGLWSDPDLGGATDDLVGCDTTRSLGYCYNATNNDLLYGSAPPAVGYDLLRGPRPYPGAPAALPMTAFGKYISGTDPSAADQSYYYMQGLLPDGSVLINPATGQPTTFFNSGDPVTGVGWLDVNAADKRMMLASGPFLMAPGDSQTVVAAVIVGQGPDRLSSISALRFYDDRIQQFFDTGTPPDTGGPPQAVACPRRSTFWGDQCPLGSGGGLTLAQLDSIARQVDAISRFFEWAPGTERAGFCEVIQGAGPLDVRRVAKTEYAALLANVAAGQLGIHESNGFPIFFSPTLGFGCPGVPAHSVEGLLAPPSDTTRRLLDGVYVNADTTHRTALAAVDWGGPVFDGGGGYAFDFLGGTLDPATMPDSFATVEIRFSHGATQKAYRYLRYEQEDGSVPPVGRTYQYGGYHTVPFQAWDLTHGVQLDVAFVERLATDASGNPLPAAQQPATLDSTWGPDASSMGSREYLFVVGRPYSDTPKPPATHDGAPIDDSQPYLYALWARLRDPGDVVDDGDLFRFVWGAPPDTTFETWLARLETEPLSDPAVTAAYENMYVCFSGLNAGDGVGPVCDAPTPVLVSLVSAQAQPDRVVLTWHAGAAGLTATLERSQGSAWTALATLTADGSGMLRYVDRDVTPGGRYGYRLRMGGDSAPLAETWVEVPLAPHLALAGLRPNPATRDLTVWFTLPARAAATLELLDVTGRRVLAREVGGLGAGSHSLSLDEDGRLPAGLYFVRLSQRGEVVTARGVVVR